MYHGSDAHQLAADPESPQAIAGFVLGATLITGASGGAAAQDASPSAADCNVEQAVADAALVYTVDSEQSTAIYTAMEELASVGANEVVRHDQRDHRLDPLR